MGAVASFEIILMMLKDVLYTIQDKRKGMGYILFIDVVDRFAITIVIEVDLYQGLRVLAKPVQQVHDNSLLFECRRLHLKDGNEDLVQQDLDFFLRNIGFIEYLVSELATHTFSLVRMPEITLQNISTLISKT